MSSDDGRQAHMYIITGHITSVNERNVIISDSYKLREIMMAMLGLELWYSSLLVFQTHQQLPETMCYMTKC